MFFGSKKIYNEKIILGQNNFVEKKLLSKKFRIKIFFGSQKISLQNFFVQNVFGHEKNLGFQQFSVSKEFLVLK